MRRLKDCTKKRFRAANGNYFEMKKVFSVFILFRDFLKSSLKTKGLYTNARSTSQSKRHAVSNSLVDHAWSKFCTLVWSTYVGTKRGFQHANFLKLFLKFF